MSGSGSRSWRTSSSTSRSAWSPPRRDPQGRPTVVDLVGHETRVVPVGRLDIDTSGVLLLTNDGDLAHRLAHPRYGVEKTYVADVEGDLTPAAVQALGEGVELDDGVTAPARVRQLGRSRVELVLHEGRNRQVRRMCEALGYPGRAPAPYRLRRSRRARGGARRLAAAAPRRGRGPAAARRAVDGVLSGSPACEPATRTRRASRARRRRPPVRALRRAPPRRRP